MGDLIVESLQMFPRELETGQWPADYDLSDHGIVECIFSAEVLGPMPSILPPVYNSSV